MRVWMSNAQKKKRNKELREGKIFLKVKETYRLDRHFVSSALHNWYVYTCSNNECLLNHSNNNNIHDKFALFSRHVLRFILFSVIVFKTKSDRFTRKPNFPAVSRLAVTEIWSISLCVCSFSKKRNGKLLVYRKFSFGMCSPNWPLPLSDFVYGCVWVGWSMFCSTENSITPYT